MSAVRNGYRLREWARRSYPHVALRRVAALAAVMAVLSGAPALADEADEAEVEEQAASAEEAEATEEAQAAEEAVEELEAEERRSVASHIRTAWGDTVRPVAVIDREDIALSGARDVEDLLFSRQILNNFGLNRPLFFGSDRSAVLINGRRVSEATLDLDLLPLSAVERVEILSGGAPALHGGHAIAGAVNIVLRRGYEGVEASAYVGRPNDSGGDAEQGSALWGGRVGQGHMTIGLDAYRIEEIPDAARAHSRAQWTPGGKFADAAGISAGGNTVLVATRSYDENDPEVVTATHVNGIDDYTKVRTIGRPLGDCPTGTYTGVLRNPRGVQGTGCGFPYADISWGAGRYERKSLFLALDQPLDDESGMYLDVRFATDELAERFAPTVGLFSLPSDVLEAQLPLGRKLVDDPQIDSLPEKVRVNHRFIGHGNRDWLTTVDEYDVTLGLEGVLADDIGYDAHLRYYRYDAAETGSTFVAESAITALIESGDYNLVDPTSAANREAISESSLRLARDQLTERRTVRASLDGPMFALGGGEAEWAAGFEAAAEDWRNYYAYLDRTGRAYTAPEVLGVGGYRAAGDRQTWSGFAELSLPVHDILGVSLAGRTEEHDDVGRTYSHQVASRLRVHDGLTLRGAWDKGSKPPSLLDMHLETSNSFPWVCDRTTHTGPLADCAVEQVVHIGGGNPDLEPDEVESFSVGAVTGAGPLSLSADWFWIELSDTAAEPSSQSIVDLEARGALPPGVAVVREGGTIKEIRGSIGNTGESEASGVDVRAQVGFDTDVAEFVFDTRWLHVARSEERVAGERQPGDFSRDRVHASLRASRDNLTASWDIHAVSNVWNNRRTGQYDGWVGHSVSLRASDAFGLGGLDLIGGVLNLADRSPSVDPTNPDGVWEIADAVQGRMVFLNATMSW